MLKLTASWLMRDRQRPELWAWGWGAPAAQHISVATVFRRTPRRLRLAAMHPGRILLAGLRRSASVASSVAQSPKVRVWDLCSRRIWDHHLCILFLFQSQKFFCVTSIRCCPIAERESKSGSAVSRDMFTKKMPNLYPQPSLHKRKANKEQPLHPCPRLPKSIPSLLHMSWNLHHSLKLKSRKTDPELTTQLQRDVDSLQWYLCYAVP